MRISQGLIALVAVGCGGAAAPPPPQEPGPASAPAPEPEPEEPSDDEVLAERRENFIGVCNQSGNNGDYCACTWDQLKEVVSREEILADRTTPAQVEELRRRALLHCVDEIPEETVKKAFQEGCSSKANPKFCACAYTELRSRVSSRDIATRGGEDREGFVSKRQEALTACVEHIDTATVKNNFVQACVDAGSPEGRCLCAWDVVSKRASIFDVALDRIDLKKIGPEIRQKCRNPTP